MTGDVNDVMPRSDGLRILGDCWKKAISWDLRLDKASWFLDLGDASPVGSTRCAARCWVRWNSQHSRNCVSLSPRVEKPKSQEGNKSFVPEQRKSSLLRGIPMPMNVSRIRIFYIYEYVTWLKSPTLLTLLTYCGGQVVCFLDQFETLTD